MDPTGAADGLTTGVAPSPPPPDVASARGARAVLDASGFDVDRLEALLGTRAGHPLLEHPGLALARRRLAADDGPASVLATLFLVGDAVEAGRAERALGDGADALRTAGLIREESGGLVGTVRLVPHGDLLVASDRPDAGGGDYVVGVHRASILLGDLTLRRPVARALDVGTGGGIQALLLARHAERVVATDVNERALAFAAFNLALNGTTNVELRHGSLFEPVEGEVFGVAVSNPPYVISPETSLLYRDSELLDDGVCATLARGLPDVLGEGGYGTLAVSWVQSGDDPAGRPKSWLEGRGCDLLVLHSGTEQPLATATTWSEDEPESDERERRIDRWLDYYRDRGIEAIAYGVLVLRRRAGGGWSRVLPLHPERLRPASEQLVRIVSAQDALDRVGEDLRGARIRLAGEARIDERRRRDGTGWTADTRTLLLDGGLGYTAELDDVTVRVVEALDGLRPMTDVVAGVASAAGLPVEEVEETALRVAAAMLGTGFGELVA